MSNWLDPRNSASLWRYIGRNSVKTWKEKGVGDILLRYSGANARVGKAFPFQRLGRQSRSHDRKYPLRVLPGALFAAGRSRPFSWVNNPPKEHFPIF